MHKTGGVFLQLFYDVSCVFLSVSLLQNNRSRLKVNYELLIMYIR